MPRKLTITVPKPCHENWEQMTPVERGRFCASCTKVVTDYSLMSDEELVKALRKKTENTCGNFREDQLDRVLRGATKRPFAWKYFWQVLLPAFFFSKEASTQSSIKPATEWSQHRGAKKARLYSRDQIAAAGSIIINGVITDSLSGHGIPGASIGIEGIGTVGFSDSTGAFSIAFPTLPAGLLHISSTGYQPTFADLAVFAAGNSGKLEISMRRQEAEMDPVVIRSSSCEKRGKYYLGAISAVRHNSIFKSEKNEPVGLDVSVFPNPATRGQQYQISFGQLPIGEYRFSLYDIKGALQSQQTVSLQQQGQQQRFTAAAQLATGTYIIRLCDARGKQVYSSKLIIQ